jgi:hypothetical protein
MACQSVFTPVHLVLRALEVNRGAGHRPANVQARTPCSGRWRRSWSWLPQGRPHACPACSSKCSSCSSTARRHSCASSGHRRNWRWRPALCKDCLALDRIARSETAGDSSRKFHCLVKQARLGQGDCLAPSGSRPEAEITKEPAIPETVSALARRSARAVPARVSLPPVAVRLAIFYLDHTNNS